MLLSVCLLVDVVRWPLIPLFGGGGGGGGCMVLRVEAPETLFIYKINKIK